MLATQSSPSESWLNVFSGTMHCGWLHVSTVSNVLTQCPQIIKSQALSVLITKHMCRLGKYSFLKQESACDVYSLSK